MNKPNIIIGASKLMQAGEDTNLHNAITTSYICYEYDIDISTYLMLSDLDKIKFIRNAMRNSSLKKFDLIAYHLVKNEFTEYIHIVESGKSIWHAISLYSEILLARKKQTEQARREHIKELNKTYEQNRIGFKQLQTV